MKVIQTNCFNIIRSLSLKLSALIILISLSSLSVNARNYYFSSTDGNDAYTSTQAQNQATPWKSIAKLNSFFSTLSSGDVIYFKRGDVFYGGIVVTKSNISFNAYGSGAKPIISGLSTVSGWVSLGNNIWEAPVSNVNADVNLVMRNGKILQVGRFPNADEANGGYYNNTNSTTSSVTGPASSSTIDWTGAEVAIRLNRWDIRRQVVTSHVGGVVSFAYNADKPRVGYGYFFQRDPRTLDRDGEWWYNASARKLRVYSVNNPSSSLFQIATVDVLFSNSYNNNISISNLYFDGSDKMAIYAYAGVGVTISNCDVNNSGAQSINVRSAFNVRVSGCNVRNSLASGIMVFNNAASPGGLQITNNTVDSTALIPGMENTAGFNSGSAISCKGNGTTILNNYITNCGYNGIDWQGNDVFIKYNFVNRFNIVRDDGGGIYTFETNSSTYPTRYNRNIVSNIVLNGVGSNLGTPELKGISSRGIYCDQGTTSVLIDSNIVAYNIGSAIHGNNNAKLTYTNNVFFNNGRGYSFQRLENGNLIREIVVKKNTVYPYLFEYRNLAINLPTLANVFDEIKAMGSVDSNYYCIKSSSTDTSLITVTTYNTLTNYNGTFNSFPVVTTTAGIEKTSKNVPNTGTLEYNASSSPKVVSFPGLSRKDVFGKVYNNSVTIPAWGGMVLIPNGSASVTNNAPRANAGNDQTIVLPTSSVTLNGSATDADGTVVSYAWNKVSGPGTGNIVSPSTTSTVVNSLSSGVYKFELAATDNNGAVGRDTVQITVSLSSNLSPTANAGGDQTITLPVSSVTLSGAGTDSDGSISRYAWAKVSGPTGGTIASPSSQSTVVSGLTAGIYRFELAVTDNSGAVDRDTLQVTVNDASTLNLLPAVNPANITNGLNYIYYEGTWDLLPDFSKLSPAKSGTINNTLLTPATRVDLFAFTYSGYIDVPADGMYTFYTVSDDGSQLFIDNVLVVDNDGVHPATEKSGQIGLKAGKHYFNAEFFQKYGDQQFTVSYSSSGIAKQVIPDARLFKDNVFLMPAVNPSNTVNGLNYSYYEGSWSMLPDFSTLTAVRSGTIGTFSLSPAGTRTSDFAITYSGYVNVPTDGLYTFFTNSDDGSKLYIDNILVVANDGIHDATEVSGNIGLKAGKHFIAGRFFQRTGSQIFTVSYSTNGISKQIVPSSALYRINGVAARTLTSTTTSSTTTATATETTTTAAARSRDISSITTTPSGELKMNIYPNPTPNEFSIMLNGGGNDKVSILVTDAFGRAVWQATGTSNTSYKFGNSLPKGVYLIKVIQGTNTIVKKVVKS